MSDRWWSPSKGMGTLDWKGQVCTFTPDAGEPITFRWTECGCGQTSKMPRGKAKIAAWMKWEHFVTEHGETLVFHREGPPP